MNWPNSWTLVCCCCCNNARRSQRHPTSVYVPSVTHSSWNGASLHLKLTQQSNWAKSQSALLVFLMSSSCTSLVQFWAKNSAVSIPPFHWNWTIMSHKSHRMGTWVEFIQIPSQWTWGCACRLAAVACFIRLAHFRRLVVRIQLDHSYHLWCRWHVDRDVRWLPVVSPRSRVYWNIRIRWTRTQCFPLTTWQRPKF